MKNCLVTKLKGIVDNDNLCKIEEFVVTINVPENLSNQYNNKLMISLGIASEYTKNKVKVLDGHNAWSYDNITMQAKENLGSEVVAQDTNGINVCFPEPGKYRIKIAPKYSINTLDFGQYFNFNCSILDYTSVVNLSLKGIGIDGSLSKFLSYNKSSLYNISLTSTVNLSLSVDDILILTNNLSKFEINNVPNFIGSFDKLGSFINKLPSNFNLAATGLVGSIEGFVKSAVSAGKTSFTKSWRYLGSNTGITFNGANIKNQESNNLSWEPYGENQTKITVNNVDVIIDN